MNGDQVDAVEEIFAEGTIGHHRRQIPIGRAHHPHIHLAGMAVAQHLVGLILQDPQQLHLAGELQIADLVEEDGSSVGQFETSDAIDIGIGEGSLLVAEHLAFEEALGESAQIDLDKRCLPAGAVGMNGFGNQLLTGSALARHQDRGLCGGHPCHGAQHLHQRLRTTDDLVEMELPVGHTPVQRFGSDLLLLLQLQDRPDRIQQGQVIPGFRDEIEGSRLHSLDRQGDRSPGGHQNDRQIGAEGLDLPQQLEPLLARRGQGEVHVHQDQFGLQPAYGRNRLFGSGHCLHLKTSPFQEKGERRAYPRIVIHYQYHLACKFIIVSRSLQNRRLNYIDSGNHTRLCSECCRNSTNNRRAPAHVSAWPRPWSSAHRSGRGC